MLLMKLLEFIFNILASYLASWLYTHSSTNQQLLERDSNPPDPVAINLDRILVLDSPKFKTFDVLHDFIPLLEKIREPKVSILIEDRPSTAYHLAALVLESMQTGEWYVFSRGRMSFQGNGGLMNTEGIFKEIRKRNIFSSAWIISQQLLSTVEDGYSTWPEARSKTVPLSARANNDYPWQLIEKKFK